MTPDPFLPGAVLWLGLALIPVLLALSAWLTGAGAALQASSRARLQARAEHDEARAGVALDLAQDDDRLAGAVMLGNALLRIAAVALATGLLMRLMGVQGVAVAVPAMLLLILILTDALPRSYAISAPEDLALRVAQPMRLVVAILAPVVDLARAVARLVLRLFGLRVDPDAATLSVQEEIADALSVGGASGTMLKADRDLLLGALDLGERSVEEIMLHRSQIEMIDASMTPRAIIDRVLASNHTRLPVFRDERENVIGVIHAKDLLRAVHRAARTGDAATMLDGFDPLSVAMKPYFVPETTALDEQLREFLKRRSHFALVVDEYGGLRGLITLEDIIEEIVGEISDEHDTGVGAVLAPLATGDFVIDGATTIRDLNRALDWNLPDDEANTVAGLVIHAAQSIPQPGQVFSFHGYRFEVVSRRENRITRLKIRPRDA